LRTAERHCPGLAHHLDWPQNPELEPPHRSFKGYDAVRLVSSRGALSCSMGQLEAPADAADGQIHLARV
jgi:hypothetical protein